MLAAATVAEVAAVRDWFALGCALTTDLAPTASASTTTNPADHDRALITGRRV
jgi:hypothetical protein